MGLRAYKVCLLPRAPQPQRHGRFSLTHLVEVRIKNCIVKILQDAQLLKTDGIR